MSQIIVEASLKTKAKEIQYRRYTAADHNTPLMEQMVACYQDVFADEPWYEWRVCPSCKQHFGKKDAELLSTWEFRHCGVPLAEFWPSAEVSTDIQKEITPNASCWLAMEGKTVIGFCWGYPITVEALEAKMGIAFSVPSHLNELLHPESVVAHQDELGLVRRYRGLKIAKILVARRLEDFLAQGTRIGIVRTRETPEPSSTFLWYKRIGYEAVARYPDGRVVLARSLEGLQATLE